MITTVLQKKLLTILPPGKKSLQGFIKEALILRLQETSQKIALFEGKYNKNFAEFRQTFKKAKGAKKYSYGSESDYMDWEALEMYKRELMRVLHSL
ncbi:MAG: hypothetical protein HYT98_02835 [Candidatus Sungbacteria bacterium]|nr:hypothetical protein [Candidatus Sungbacteria bacterium]